MSPPLILGFFSGGVGCRKCALRARENENIYLIYLTFLGAWGAWGGDNQSQIENLIQSFIEIERRVSENSPPRPPTIEPLSVIQNSEAYSIYFEFFKK